MKRSIVGVLVLLAWAGSGDAHASCDDAAPRPVKINVYVCNDLGTVGHDTRLEHPASGKGIVLEGTLMVEGEQARDLVLWVPANEKLECARVKPGASVTGTLDEVCCGQSTDPACIAGTSYTLTNVKFVAPRSVKKALRGQLEAEVEQLRRENARLRTELFKITAAQRQELERLRKEQQELSKKMK